MAYLLQHAGADGDGPRVVTRGYDRLTLHVFGAFDGASVDIHASGVGYDSAASVVDSNLTFTSKAMSTIVLAKGVTLWARVSSAGTSTDISCVVMGNDG